MSDVHVVLVPGFWLGGWAWDEVADDLRAAGRSVTAVTPPGLGPEDDPATVTWSDQVELLLQLVRRLGPEVVLVAHSGAGGVVTGVLDSAPEAVARVVYVDSGPGSDGAPYSTDVPAGATTKPLPTFDELVAGGASLAGITPAQLEAFRRRGRPEPADVLRHVLQLGDERRHAVPATFVNCSFTTAQVRQLVADDVPMFRAVGQLVDVTHVDLPTGHWPMFSRPHDLAAVLLAATGG